MVLRERRKILDANKGGEQPKDIMSILRKLLRLSSYKFSRSLKTHYIVQANSEATQDDRLSEEQLLGQMKLANLT